MSFSGKDRQIVRDLAKKVAELAADPIQEAKLAEWRRHNSLKPGRPLVLQAPEGVWEEFVPASSVQCEDDLCRGIEHGLRCTLYSAEHFRDDRPVTAEMHTPLFISYHGWKIKTHTTSNPDTPGVHGAVRYDPVFGPEDDIDELLPMQTLEIDWERSEQQYQQVADLLGDIMTVTKRGHGGSWFASMDVLIQWRGLENIMLDMIDRPEWVHRVLERMTVNGINLVKLLDEANALSLNNGNNTVGSGGLGTTDELPAGGFDGEHVRPIDMWGHATTQIFSEVSPAMHDEFAIQYEARFLDLFGLNCYGCCEPLHKKVHLVRKLPRVRRLSMSPWVEPVEGAEQIGGDMIYSSKPNPAFLAAGTWDIEPCRKEMIATLEACKANGCISEYIMKDTHTSRSEPSRYDEWTDMAMQLVSDYA